MPLTIRPRVPALVIAAACLASQGAFAADPLATSGVSISNLRFKLVDLDTSDGLTPYIRFTDDSLTSLVLRGALGTPDVQGLSGVAGPSIAELSLTKPDGASTASVSLDGVHASNVINLGDETRLIRGLRTMQLELNASVISNVKFELSANTELVLEGALTSDARVNLDALVGNPLLLGSGGSHGRFLGYSANIVTVRLGDTILYKGRTDAAQQVTPTGVHPALFGNALYGFQDHETGALSGTYVNSTGGATFHTLSFIVDSRAYLSATPVPEASTIAYALCGVGAVLCAIIRRRKA